MKFGVLVPHFGSTASFPRVLDGILEAEALGFDSAWVRDHIIYHPHDFEDPDPTWLDPFIVLAAAGARATRITLGTAVLVPYRHPLHDGQLLASLASLLNDGRLILGWGRGNDDREFAAVDQPVLRRGARLEEHVEILRRLWTGDTVDFAGEFYSFRGGRLSAPGVGSSVQHWYGGASSLAIRRTVRSFDGLLASRMPADFLAQQTKQLADLADRSGRARPEVGIVCLSVPARSLAEGLSYLDMSKITETARNKYPNSAAAAGRSTSGVVVAGTPADMVAGIQEFADAGVGHFVFDFRARFDDWESLMKTVATEVMPAFAQE